MNAKSFRTGFVGILALVVLAIAPAWAADDQSSPEPSTTDGTVNAAALRPLPADAAISVKPWDNSDANMALARDIKDQLTNRGFKVSDTAPITLSFETSTAAGHWSDTPNRRIVEVQGHVGSTEVDNNTDGANVMVNLFSSDKGGLFNDRQTATNEPSTYSLQMTLDGQGMGRLWQGQADAKLMHGNEQTLLKTMVPILVENLGKTVRSQPFGTE